MRLHQQQSAYARLSGHLLLLFGLAVTCTTTYAKPNDERQPEVDSWNEQAVATVEDLCGADTVSLATCALCPSILGENALKCCHDQRTYAACAVSVISALEGVSSEENSNNGAEQQTGGDTEKRAKYFLGKRAKYFLGKRSFGDRSSYYDWRPAMRHEMLGQDFYYPYRRTQQFHSTLDKRAKYFLGK
jgi:hypothetical protein